MAASVRAAAQAADRHTAGGARSRVARNITYLAGGQLVTWSLSLLWTVFVPRNLGPRAMGELTLAYAVTGVIAVTVSLGLATLLVKEISRDHDRAGRMVGAALFIRAAMVVPTILAVSAYVYLTGMHGEQSLVLWLATGAMVVSLFTTPFQYAIQALERMEYLAGGDILNKAVVSVASIVLVFIGFRVVGLMTLVLAMGLLVLVLNVWWTRGLFRLEWDVDGEHIRSMVVGSIPYWTTGLVLTFYMWVDSVMLSLMSSDVVVGWYAVPTKVFSTLLFIPAILGTAMLPRLSAAFREGIDSVRQTGKPALELTLVLSLPLAVGAALVARPMILDIYGQAFAQSIWVMVILAATLPPTYFNIMANQVLVATNRQVAWTKVMVAAAVANPLLNLFAIRYFQDHAGNGAIGAALALMATELGMAAAGLVLLPRMLDGWSAFRVLRAIAACSGMTAVVLAVSGRGLIVEVAAGGIAFAILAVALRLVKADELAMLRRTGARMMTRSNRNSRYRGKQYRGWDDVTARPIGRLGG